MQFTPLADLDHSTGMASRLLQPPSPMVHPRQVNGLFLQVTFLTTKSNLKLVLQGPTSTIPTLDFKLSLLKVP